MRNATWKKRALELHAAGLSAREVSLKLKEEGIVTLTGASPSEQYIHNILYIGNNSKKGSEEERKRQRGLLVSLLEMLEKGKVKEAKQKILSALK